MHFSNLSHRSVTIVMSNTLDNCVPLTRSYMQRKRKSRKAGSHSTLSLLRRELREGTLHSLLGGSSSMPSSTNVAPDPLLSSFILPVAGNLSSSQPSLQIDSSSAKKSLNENVAERCVTAPGKYLFF